MNRMIQLKSVMLFGFLFCGVSMVAMEIDFSKKWQEYREREAQKKEERKKQREAKKQEQLTVARKEDKNTKKRKAEDGVSSQEAIVPNNQPVAKNNQPADKKIKLDSKKHQIAAGDFHVYNNGDGNWQYKRNGVLMSKRDGVWMRQQRNGVWMYEDFDKESGKYSWIAE